jgi:DNA-binding NarL/FixJ family response regulator
VGAACRVDEALRLVATSAPDVVVVDPRLPDVDAGRHFIARLRAIAPDTRVLAMGWSDSIEHDAVAMAADGFIRKTFRPRDLVAAVLAAARQPQD